VHGTGYLADADLPAAYSGAVATALPSLYEGFGLSAAESLACGTPVAGASTSSIPEVLGEAGLLFDPQSVPEMADALATLATDDALRARLAHAGLERAGLFSWARCAATVGSVLEAVALRDRAPLKPARKDWA
jgi:glycosyltransferase involved in cell wall biosynthesis